MPHVSWNNFCKTFLYFIYLKNNLYLYIIPSNCRGWIFKERTTTYQFVNNFIKFFKNSEFLQITNKWIQLNGMIILHTSEQKVLQISYKSSMISLKGKQNSWIISTINSLKTKTKILLQVNYNKLYLHAILYN